ncbi:MAG: exosortase/archaeosortase family protein [Parvularculaceae bacterium]|nr:exosortase/archaeosortase family protein [Parvularculaceae bacterium]
MLTQALADRQPQDFRRFLPGAIFAAGWLALYLPVYWGFAEGPWRRDENAHALIVMAIAAGAAGVRLATEPFALTKKPAETLLGAVILLGGVALAILGKIAEAELFVSASQTPVALGAALAHFGWAGVKRLWFSIALTLYLIIWPGWLLDALTGPLKIAVSQAVSTALYAAGLPVAHAGAVISAGPYQLLIADACAGLNSLIALTAVGAVYLYAVKHADWRVNAVVLVSLIPIAILANIARVTLLVLITYFLGFDAGQGFLHDGAGLLMFAIALALVFAVDGLAAAIFFRRRRRS